MALGARRPQVVSIVVRYAAARLGLGVGAGIACTVAFDRLVGSGGGATATTHYRMSDPLALIASAALLTIITVVASVAPAWSAARVDPSVTLRYE